MKTTNRFARITLALIPWATALGAGYYWAMSTRSYRSGDLDWLFSAVFVGAFTGLLTALFVYCMGRAWSGERGPIAEVVEALKKVS